MHSVAPRLRLRGGAGSHAGTSDPSTPLQPSAINSDEADDEEDNNRQPKIWKGKQRESSQSLVQSVNDISDDNQHVGPSKRQPRNGSGRMREQGKVRSDSYQSRRHRARSPSEEGSPIQTVEKTIAKDRKSGTRRKLRPPRQGDPYRLKRSQGCRTARHDEERAELSDPDDLVLRIHRAREGRRRTLITIHGIEDRFRTRERDNDMTSEEIADHVEAALRQPWARVERAPACRCVIS